MTAFLTERNKHFIFMSSFVLLIVVGTLLRFYQINQNNFFFFDEGYYLNFNRPFLETISQYSPRNSTEASKITHYFFKSSLGTGKALFFMLSDSRVFLGLFRFWAFPRVISAVSGVLTLFLTFLFAKRFYRSRGVAILSVAFLVVLPGHVFYSRLAMQEGLATLLFLGGFYLYVFSSKLSSRTFFSSVILVGAYFCNYRLIIIPLLTLMSEFFLSLSVRKTPGLRKWFWHTLIFTFLLFLIGSLYRGQNTNVTFSWMFLQAQMANQYPFNALNFLSYPYYLFRLENVIFALLFFGNIYFLISRKKYKAFPFVLVFFQMFCFSFAMEKGARYIAVVMPFMVIASSALVVHVWEKYQNLLCQMILAFVVVFALTGMANKSIQIVQAQSDYQPAVKYLTDLKKGVKFLSTQPYVQNLFIKDRTRVEKVPLSYRGLVKRYQQGYHYLVLGPQAYVSLTESHNRFDGPLRGYLNFIERKMTPIAIFPHFNRVILDRFVLEHNQDLSISIKFLNKNSRISGELRIFRVAECIRVINQLIAAQQGRMKGNAF